VSSCVPEPHTSKGRRSSTNATTLTLTPTAITFSSTHALQTSHPHVTNSLAAEPKECKLQKALTFRCMARAWPTARFVRRQSGQCALQLCLHLRHDRRVHQATRAAGVTGRHHGRGKGGGVACNGSGTCGRGNDDGQRRSVRRLGGVQGPRRGFCCLRAVDVASRG
jgi:hypothetical protein